MMLKKTLIAMLLSAVTLTAWAGKYQYETVEGDPLNAKIYTLPNGLKIYMSVNKDAPRIQTNIAVRVGGKNDPAETTGLAHYFEHLMFKGTPVFGTTDYEREKPMLDQIEQLFETYRVTTDSTQRAHIYHAIDSISYEASKLAIPNEYDKLMSTIGASGTNAYTSYDETCYVEQIPSNQIDNWARIQAIRFKNPVLRGFHTELETIYEEKNMSLTEDGEKTFEKLMAMLFPNHPYGRQTILGSQEHLKNPSITNVKNYHDKWYVPNNIAIVMSGDFDPDNVVDIITKYFGDMEPNTSLTMMPIADEAPVTAPLSAEVNGLESEHVCLAWRLPKAAHSDMDAIEIMDAVLSNGSTGLIDLNVNQKQLTMGVGAYPVTLADHSLYIIEGSPKAGQTLEQVRDIALAQVEKLRNGEFDESLITAIINNSEMQLQKGIESNGSRVSMMVGSFIQNQPWSDVVESIERSRHITKQDVVDVARKYLGPENYAIVYKRQGKDEEQLKIAKPKLTPIVANRDAASDFLTEIQNNPVEPIEPVFVDYNRDLTFLSTGAGQPVLYKKNTTNDLFQLTYVFETGSYADRLLPYANGYVSLLGTPDKTPEQIKNEFYALGCSYGISVGGRRSYITLSGLSKNMDAAMKLMEDVLANAVVDKEVWDELAARNIKARQDNKGDQGANFSALRNYAIYGEDYIKHGLSNDELTSLDPALIIDAARKLREYPHRVIYYGPLGQDELLSHLAANHYTPAEFAPLPVADNNFLPALTPETVIYLAPYDSNQIYMYMISNNGEHFNQYTEPMRRLYNSYFGGDMSSIVFQEMRERRSLAYSASAGYSGTSHLDTPYSYTAFIATQNDKMMDAINAFAEIINDMPRSEKAFRLAKESLDGNLRTQRVIKDNVAWNYISDVDMQLTEPASKRLFEALPAMTLDDVVKYQQEHVKDRTYIYCILGRIEDLDVDALKALGKVVILTPEQTFGY